MSLLLILFALFLIPGASAFGWWLLGCCGLGVVFIQNARLVYREAHAVHRANRANRETRRSCGNYEPIHRPIIDDVNNTTIVNPGPPGKEEVAVDVPVREVLHEPPGYEDTVAPFCPRVTLEDHPCEDRTSGCDSRNQQRDIDPLTVCVAVVCILLKILPLLLI